VVRQIAQAFDDEGFYPAAETAAPGGDWYQEGQRRGTFDRHTHSVNWADPSQVRRVLNVFQEILSWAPDDYQARLVGYLGRDGYRVDDLGRIETSVVVRVPEIPLEAVADAASIREHLDRIERGADSDPAMAISSAKALIEATTKLVLNELGESYDERADLPALVRATQRALGLHPDAIAPTAKGAESIRRILSNLSQVAIGVAELRNEYGPDHGRTRATIGLGPRHAHLAVGCAGTYCRMLLETLEARKAAT